MNNDRRARGAAALWAGAVLGGSLIAAPAKFQAQSLTLEVALDVGRAQFRWLGALELGLCVALILFATTALRSGTPGSTKRWIAMSMVGGAVVLFAVQRLVIMPPLDARALRVIAGKTPEPSSLHRWYIVLECIKVAALIAYALRPNAFPERARKDTR